MRKLLFSSIMALLPFILSAQVPGTLDGTFNTMGYVITDLISGDDWGRSLVIQPNGKIVAGGRTFDTKWNFSMVRYLPNGTLDAGFGNSGKVVTPMGSEGGAYAVARQNDGKLILAGYYNNGSNYDFALARYDTAGVLDPSFDGDGKVSLAVGSSQDVAHALIVQPDQKILVVGSAGNGSDLDIALARFLPNGSPDATFGTGGKLTTPVGTGDDDAFAITLQPNGKILVAGYSIAGSDLRGLLIRYLPDGSLDNTFGTGGIAQTASTGQSNVFLSVERQSNGYILVSGYNSIGNVNRNFLIIRCDTTGMPDAAFGTGGRVLTDFAGNNDEAYSVLVQQNGQIVTAGYSDNGSAKCIALARYSATGILDNTFGTGGMVTTCIGSPDVYGVDAALQSDGKILVAGRANGPSNIDYVVARYNGTLLTAINGNTSGVQAGVYPDPATHTITVTMAGERYDMEIIDVNGQLVKTIANVEISTSVDISDLAGGLYFIRCSGMDTKKRSYQKFIKY